MEHIQKAFKDAIQKLFDVDFAVELTRPDYRFGDLTTNAAMKLAAQLGKKPREIAEQLCNVLREVKDVADVNIAGPGFINIRLSDDAIISAALGAPFLKPQNYKDQVVVAEYSDPNPFKVLHAGHLYTSIVGDSIANILKVSGATVHKVNFGGDVGLHVAKTMWSILKELGGENPEKLDAIDNHAEWMAKNYVTGTNAYEEDENAKTEIVELNKRVYKLFEDNDHDSPFAQVYWTCRQWSYDYFNAFYARINTPFEKYYPESEVAPLGLATVREQLAKGVYKESDGAVVFEGEPYGLHTRVFINSHGLPTYEAKDVGLIMAKWNDYHFDKSVVITGNDITEYMKVVLKSIEQFQPELVRNTVHFTHGNVKLQGGVKMSSRKGNFLRAVDVLDAAAEANKQATGREDEQVVLGAVKYSFLKQRIGPDIIFIPEESVSLEGNSGPYLQYAHSRARSILQKIPKNNDPIECGTPHEAFECVSPMVDEYERSLAAKLGQYPQELQKAAVEMLPHYICTYLYELAQEFNRFYEHAKVVGDPRESARRQLVEIYANVLEDGLTILGIPAPNRL
jgi:arginyl-tRNA synthetase